MKITQQLEELEPNSRKGLQGRTQGGRGKAPPSRTRSYHNLKNLKLKSEEH